MTTDLLGNRAVVESEEQGAFEFPLPPRVPLPERLSCVLSWRDDGVATEWLETHLRAWFHSWEAELSCVLHPLNENVRLRIRS